MSIAPRRDIDWNILRRYAAAAYVTGSVVGLVLSAYVPTAKRSDAIWLAGVGFALGLALALGPRMPGWMVRMFAISGAILLISADVAVSHPIGPTPFWYVLPAIAIARFCGRLETLTNLVLLCASYAIALGLAAHPEVPVLMYGSVIAVSLLLVGAHGHQVRFTRDVMAKLELAAAIDPLTGLLNRGALGVAFPRELERAKTSGLMLSVVLFDLDLFKSINDTFGHDTGDRVLRRFAAILEDERSTADLAARLGGEEFLAVLFDADAATAARFAERVATRLAAPADRTLPAVTTSAGIASLTEELDSPSLLLTAADRALYWAKESGRNRIVVADHSMLSPPPSDLLPPSGAIELMARPKPPSSVRA